MLRGLHLPPRPNIACLRIQWRCQMHRLQRAFLASSATLCTKGLPPGCTNSTKARSISVKTCKRNGTDGGQGLSVSGLIMPSQFRFAANPLGEDTMSAYARADTLEHLVVVRMRHQQGWHLHDSGHLPKVHYSDVSQGYGCANCGGCRCLRAQVLRKCEVRRFVLGALQKPTRPPRKHNQKPADPETVDEELADSFYPHDSTVASAIWSWCRKLT